MKKNKDIETIDKQIKELKLKKSYILANQENNWKDNPWAVQIVDHINKTINKLNPNQSTYLCWLTSPSRTYMYVKTNILDINNNQSNILYIGHGYDSFYNMGLWDLSEEDFINIQSQLKVIKVL